MDKMSELYIVMQQLRLRIYELFKVISESSCWISISMLERIKMIEIFLSFYSDYMVSLGLESPHNRYFNSMPQLHGICVIYLRELRFESWKILFL